MQWRAAGAKRQDMRGIEEGVDGFLKDITPESGPFSRLNDDEQVNKDKVPITLEEARNLRE